MPPDDEVRLGHLVEAAETAIRFITDRSREDLNDDEMLRLALTKLVEIVGEAAKQVTPRHTETKTVVQVSRRGASNQCLNSVLASSSARPAAMTIRGRKPPSVGCAAVATPVVARLRPRRPADDP